MVLDGRCYYYSSIQLPSAWGIVHSINLHSLQIVIKCMKSWAYVNYGEMAKFNFVRMSSAAAAALFEEIETVAQSSRDKQKMSIILSRILKLSQGYRSLKFANR